MSNIVGSGNAHRVAETESEAETVPVSDRAGEGAGAARGSVPARHALGQALANDAGAIVSEADARAVVDAALRAISEADSPREVFELNKKTMGWALEAKGADPDTARILRSYAQRAAEAVSLRLEVLNGERQLPLSALRQVESELGGLYGSWAREAFAFEPAAVEISSVDGDESAGFSFSYTAGTEEGQAFVIEYENRWVLAPTSVTTETLDRATADMRDYFDRHMAGDLIDEDATPEEVAKMREAIVPVRVMFPREPSDPAGLCDSYDLVITMHNPTGSDHGLFAGINPGTDVVSSYAYK